MAWKIGQMRLKELWFKFFMLFDSKANTYKQNSKKLQKEGKTNLEKLVDFY